MFPCPTDAELEKLLDERVSAGRADLESHLGECSACQQTLLRLSGDATECLRRDPGQTLVLSARGAASAAQTLDAEPNVEFLDRLKDSIRTELRLDSPHAAPGDESRPIIPGYDIIDQLGHGATAVVYRARHLSLRRLVALKVILTGKHAAPETLARFRTEAEAVARLQHPNIVQVFDIGTADGLPYLSLEYVAGGSLAQHLARGPANLLDAARFVAVLARAIQYAHDCGIIHRDLKPANILLTTDANVSGDNTNPSAFKGPHAPVADFHAPIAAYQPKIADFGLARRLEEDQHLTETGAILGTPRYMAPEQAQPGRPGQTVGRSVDIHALGAILYEMIAGRPPFEAASSLDTLMQVIHQEPLSPRRLRPETPTDLETIVLKCLQKDPRHRYASALDLAQDLECFLAGQPIAARPISAAERVWRWARRHPSLAGLLASFVVVTVSALLIVSLALLEARSSQTNEAAQRQKAEKAYVEAKDALAKSERSLYFSNIAQARAQYLLNNVRASAQLLERCPLELRGWEWRYLYSLLHADLLTIDDTGGPYVGALTYSADGQWLAVGAGSPFSGSEQGTVHIYDAVTGKPRWKKADHRYQVYAVAFAPDGGQLVAGGGKWFPAEKGELRVWDAATGTLVRELGGHTQRVTTVAFNRDGSQLVSASTDGAVRLWDAKTWTEVWRAGHKEEVRSVVFTPDGRFVFTSGFDGTRVWVTATGKPWAVLPDLNSLIALSPDGNRLASLNLGGAKVWDLAPLLNEKSPPLEKITALPLVHSLSGHEGPVLGVAFSPDGKTLATAGADGAARTWNLADGRERLVLRGHQGRVAALAFHPDGFKLASGGAQPGDVKVWDLTRPTDYAIPVDFASERADINALVFTKGDRELTVLASGGLVRSWDPVKGTLSPAKKLDCTREWMVPAATGAFSADGRRLVSVPVSENAKIKVWELESGMETRLFEEHAAKVWHITCDARGDRVASAAWHRKDGRLVSERLIWEAASGKVLQTETPTDRIATALALSPDGTWLAEAWQVTPAPPNKAGAVSEVRLVEVKSGGAVRRLIGPPQLVRALAFSSDGRRIAAAFESGVQVWDARTGDALHPELLPSTESLAGLAFSPDGARLAGVGRDRVQLWDVVSGQDLLFLRGAEPRPHDNGFNPRIAWSQDGAILAASNWNRTVSIWDATDPTTTDGKARVRRHAAERADRQTIKLRKLD